MNEQKRKGSPRPGNGGKREGTGPKPLAEKGLIARTERLTLRVTPEQLSVWQSMPLSVKRELARTLLDALTEMHQESME